jgi:LysR family transcriptional regulator, nod-box dependent transcriptional activator
VTPSIYSDRNYVTEHLLTNELALVGWRDNPALTEQPDLATVLSLQQVIVEFDRVRLASFLNHEQLALYGGTDRIALIAPNFSCIPPCLEGTNWISLIYRDLAILAARDHSLAIWRLPVPMPSLSEVMMFHPLRRQDAGLYWLRDQLRGAVAEIHA